MPLTPEKIAALDAKYGVQPDYLTQLTEPKAAVSTLTPEKIAALDAKYGVKPDAQPQQVGVGEDLAKTAASELAQGALSVPFGVADIANQLVAGPQYLGRGIAEGVDKLIGIEPQERGEIWQPFYGSQDAAKYMGVDYIPKTAAGSALSIPAQLAGAIFTGKGINAITKPRANDTESFLRNNMSGPARAIPSAQKIREVSGKTFEKSEASGGVLKPNITDSWADDALKTMPQTPAGKTLFGQSANADLVAKIDSLRGKPLNLAEAQEIDSHLGSLMEKHIDPRTGKFLAEGETIRQIQQSLRDRIEKATAKDIQGGVRGFREWKLAKDQWAASSRMSEIERIMARGADSENGATVIKNGFAALKNNPSRMRGYTPAERAAIHKAAQTGVLTGIMKTFGSKFISSVAGGIAGSSAGPLGTAAGVAAGSASSGIPRSIAAKMQANKGNRVRELIGGRPAVRKGIP